MLYKEKEDLSNLANRLISDSFKQCASKYHCFDALHHEDAHKVALACLGEVRNMQRKEKKLYMIAKVWIILLNLIHNN